MLTRSLWHIDGQYGGGAAIDAATGVLSSAYALLDATTDGEFARGLCAAIADLHDLVGWSLHDLGRHATACRHFTSALALGVEAEDRSLVASALYRLGRVSLHIGQPGDALRTFQLGQIAAQDAGSYADLARLHLSSAWAYALLGQPDRMADSFSRAEHELGRADPDEVPPWARAFVQSGDIHGVRGFASTILARRAASDAGRYAEAAMTWVAAPAETRPARSRVFDEIIYAAGMLQTGNRAQGVDLAHAVIDRIEHLHSVRAIDRLDDLDRAAALMPSSDTDDVRHRIVALRHP